MIGESWILLQRMTARDLKVWEYQHMSHRVKVAPIEAELQLLHGLGNVFADF